MGQVGNGKKELKKIKSSVLSRSLTLAKLTLTSGAKLATHGIGNVIRSSEEKKTAQDQFWKDQAKKLTLELGELKGSLMKAGQMLSMYGEHFFPSEANEILKSLQHDSPPLAWTAIEPLLHRYLSSELLQELEISTEALACASLGQVHRAKIKSTGEQVVLKIQYPDVDKAIDSDLKAIKSLLSVMKLMPKDFNSDAIFDEVRSMLIQETNYDKEREWTEYFAENLQQDSRYIVPKVYARYSNNRILCTSFERGLRVDDSLIQAMPQERRNKLALTFLDLYLKEVFELGTVQTDPHLGNYRIRVNPNGQDQIVLLDFGATRFFEKDFLLHYRRMIKGAFENQPDKFRKAALALGFIAESDSDELKNIFETFCFETVEPFIAFQDPRNSRGLIAEDGTYDWKNTDLPNRLTEKIFQIIKGHSWRTPPKQLIFLDRKTGGVFIFLSVLKARISSKNLLENYTRKID